MRRGQSSVEPMLVVTAITLLLVVVGIARLPEFTDLCAAVVDWFVVKLRIDIG